MDNHFNQLVELLNCNLAQCPSVIEYLLSRYPRACTRSELPSAARALCAPFASIRPSVRPLRGLRFATLHSPPCAVSARRGIASLASIRLHSLRDAPKDVDINFVQNGYLGYVKHQIVSHDALYWRNYEEILVDILAVIGIQPGQLNKFLTDTKPAEKNLQDFESIRSSLYETLRYPLTEHLYYAHLEEAILRREFVAEAVSLIPYDEARVCDIGCGPGVIISTILKAKPNFQISGIDISSHCINYAGKLLETKNLSAKFLQADLRKLPFLEAVFDVVVGTEVFEHIPNPKIAFFEVVRILKPEGYFIASIPVKMVIPTHLYIFNEEEILLLFEEIGMEIIASGTKQFQSGIATFLLAKRVK